MTRQSPSKKLYRVKVEMPSGAISSIDVKAASDEVAKARALKRMPTAIRVYSLERIR